MFYFFSHPGMLGLTFPCTTGLGGTDPGKPCTFSEESNCDYNSDVSVLDHCYTMETPTPACYTRARTDQGCGDSPLQRSHTFVLDFEINIE